MAPTSRASSRGVITLLKGKARPVWAGHPWIYSGAIARVDADVREPGMLVDVCDDRGRHIGVGSFSPTARIAVRMLQLGPLSEDIGALIAARITAARDLRRAFGLPNVKTTAFRLVNGEGDGLPGIIIDVFGSLASVQLTTAAAEAWRPHVIAALDEPLVQVAVPTDSARMEGIDPGDRFGRGDCDEHVPLLENGIEWRLKPGAGQKTGFYTDQRENRARIGAMAAGRDVLDTFCYTGGFSLNCARAGATEVIGVDSSGPAVSVASGTAKQNGIEGVRFFKEDAIRYIKNLDAGRRFGMVIMDPPKLAKSRKNLDDAFLKYRAINAAGLSRVAPGGFFVSCSCSGLVDEEMFLRMLTDAAHRAGRRLVIHAVHGPGPDHATPAAFAEGRYLKVVTASVPG